MLLLLLSSTILSAQEKIDPEQALAKGNYPALFDPKFKQFLHSQFSLGKFNHRSIGTTEHLKEPRVYSFDSFTSIKLDERILLTEAFLDYAVLGDKPGLPVPILSELINMDISDRITFSDPWFIDFLVKKFADKKPSITALFKHSPIKETEKLYLEKIEAIRPAYFTGTGKYGYVDIDLNAMDVLLPIAYIEFTLESSKGMAKSLLQRLRYDYLANIYWDRSSFKPQNINFIKTEYSDLETLEEIKHFHASYDDDDDPFGFYVEDRAFEIKLETENTELLSGIANKVEDLSWDGFLSLVRVVENQILMDPLPDEDFEYTEQPIDIIKANQGFKQWLKANIGNREPTADDLGKFGLPHSLEWPQKDKVSKELFEEFWSADRVLRSLYERYQTEREDKQAKEFVDLLKSDHYFMQWLNNKLGKKKLTLKTIGLLGQTTFITFNDENSEISLITQDTQDETKQKLYEAAYSKYQEEGYVAKYRVLEKHPVEIMQELQTNIDFFAEWPTFAKVCLDSKGRYPRIRVDWNLVNTGKAFIFNDDGYPLIRLDAQPLSKMNSLTIIWQILHECAHHALGHVKHDEEKDNLSHDDLVKIELASDCWASQHILGFILPIPNKTTRKLENREFTKADMYIITEGIKRYSVYTSGYPPAEKRIKEVQRCTANSPEN